MASSSAMRDSTWGNESELYTNSQASCSYDVEFQALEVPGDGLDGGQISNCNQVPTDTTFNDIHLATGTSSNPSAYDPISFSPNFHWPIGGRSPNCNWSFVYGSNWVSLSVR
jgi:hypothetical protein